METVTSGKFPFQERLLTLLKEALPLHSVYVISMQTDKSKREVYLPPSCKMQQKAVTYTLLVIGHKSPARNLQDFMDSLNSKMKGRCQFYVIFHTVSNVLKRLNIGDNFLNRIVSRTPCMFAKDDSLAKLGNMRLCVHEALYEQACKEWHDRMERADHLLSTIGIIDDNYDAVSQMTIMHFAMEQVCIGLLSIFWEYSPNHYTLPYLFHLCGHFTNLPQRIFPRTTFGLQRQFYMLCNAHQIMRFKGKIDFSSSDVDKALYRCERFYEEACKLGEVQLQNLREMHCNHDG